MIHNQDEHGIRYTLYSMNSIDSEMIETLLYQHGKNISEAAVYEEETARQKAEFDAAIEIIAEYTDSFDVPNFEPNLDNFHVDIDEPIIEGTYQGVNYRTTWLGGAQLLWVFKSSIIGHFRLCSPCVPNACDGDSPTPRADGFCGYAVPPDWLFVDPEAPKIDWYGEEF